MTPEEFIRKFADENPTFTSAGFECPPERFEEWRAELFTTEFADMVCTAVIALTEKLPRGYPWALTRLSSYTQKHLVEGWVRRVKNSNYAPYIRNGALIIAMADLGYVPKPYGVNAMFKKRRAKLCE